MEIVRVNKIDERKLPSGLRALLYEGVCSQVMDSFTGGAILVAFALLLGASNTLVGLLAALSPLTQLLQIPSIYLVDRLTSRKALVVVSSLLSRIFWLITAIIPWLVADEFRLPLLFVCLFLFFGLGSISACAFNPWMRDFVPEKIMGRFFGRAMAMATGAGAAVTVLVGIGLEITKRYAAEQFIPYSILFVLGGVVGLVGVHILRKVPEPKITAPMSQGVFEPLGRPFLDVNFRRLLIFLGIWFFGINLTGPFYAVYMIKQLQLPMALIISLSALSQIASVMSFRIWGKAADRFSNKSVLFVSGHLYILSVLIWPLLSLFDHYFLMIPLLITAHVLIGISAAGVNLCTANIALKSAPHGKSTAFLAVNTLTHGIAAASAPIIGGIIADALTGYQLSSAAHTSSTSSLAGPALHGLQFIFFLTPILGLYAMNRLRVISEEGEVKLRVVVSYVSTEAVEVFRYVINIISVFRNPREFIQPKDLAEIQVVSSDQPRTASGRDLLR